MLITFQASLSIRSLSIKQMFRPNSVKSAQLFQERFIKMRNKMMINNLDISRIFIIISMPKRTISLLCLLTLAILIQSVMSQSKQIRLHNDQPNLTDKEIMQQALNGIFRQNNLPEPTTIVVCFDEATAHKVVQYTGQSLNKSANGSFADVWNIYNASKEFAKQLPDPVKKCLNGNAQFESLGLKYGIDNSTTSDQIDKKVIQYLVLHFLNFHKWAISVNYKWNVARYYQAAFEAAGYANLVLPIPKSPFNREKTSVNRVNSFQKLSFYQQLTRPLKLLDWKRMF